MPPTVKDDIFSDGLIRKDSRLAHHAFRIQGRTLDLQGNEQLTCCTSEMIKELDATVPIDTPMLEMGAGNPRKKDGREMSDKAVGTSSRDRRHKKRQRIDTYADAAVKEKEEIGVGTYPRVAPTLAPKSSTTSLSSQISFWDGDEKWDEIIAELDKKDEQEVENLPETQPLPKDLSWSITERSDSSSSGTSSTMSAATESTSVYSEALFLVESPSKATSHSSGGGKRDDNMKAHEVDCDSTPKPRIRVACATGKPPKILVEQNDTVDSPISTVLAFSHEKSAHPKVKPIAKGGDSSVCKKMPIREVIDLTNSDEETDAPASRETSPDKLTEKTVVSGKAIANKVLLSDAIQSPVDARKAASRAVESPPDVQPEEALSPFLLAHDRRAQILLDKYVIARGVQFEIARGISQGLWGWDCISDETVVKLTGRNSDIAPLIPQIINSSKSEGTLTPSVLASRAATFAELDREHDARLEGQGRGLGLMGAWQGVDNWYGGRVQQVARLTEFDDKSGAMKITLDRLEMGRSNRLTRFLGSVSVLQIRIKKNLVTRYGNALIKALARRFVICGRIFLPFHAKENKIYLAEVNENYQRTPVSALGDETRLSWEDFIKWHNPLMLNARQPISKWSTRWALTLSTSTPVIEFAPKDIHFIRDEYAKGQAKGTETMMTDGCGFINLSALILIALVMKIACPLVVQGRIGGNKGLWLLHPDPNHRVREEPPMIWIRDSQYKIKLGHPDSWDRSHRIFDLVRLQRLTIPSSLYMQTIMNMSYNGVEDSVFSKLLEDGLRREIDPLIAWTGHHASARLAKAVENAGGLMGTRLGRLVGSEARAYNFIRDEEKEAELEVSDDDEENKGLIERHASSGFPISLYESTRELLQAGFHPLTSSIVREKLKNIVKIVMDQYMEQYHITVPQSVEAFIVPDPYGVLEEGQIYFRSSKPILDPATSADPHTFSGPVLITRNPTRVASDVQKVTAVVHDKLLPYMDVIIFPIKGKRSLASYLGGGDYDGDTVTIIADTNIIEGFRKPPTISEPQDLRSNFESEVEEVKAFVDRINGMPTLQKERELCMKLLLGLSDSKVGLYSQFHDNAVYRKGYNHPETVRLAYMFTTCLDSSKTGLRIKPAIFRRDSLAWNRPRPDCMQKAVERQLNFNSGSNMNPFDREKGLGRFVLDSLKRGAKQLRNDILIQYENLCKEAYNLKDVDLVKPYRDAQERVLRLKDAFGILEFSTQFEAMKSEVQDLCREYIRRLGEYYRSSPKKPRMGQAISYARPVASSISRQEVIRSLVERFNAIESDLYVDSLYKEVKASYAYIYAFESHYDGMLAREFPFCMAHDALCAVKARKEGAVSITQESADLLTISGKLLQTPVRD